MATALPAPNIACNTILGLRTDIQFNAHYMSEDELLYPVGNVIVVQNLISKKQRFIKLPESKKEIKSMVLAPNKRWLALSEYALEGHTPTITIYDLNTFKRRKILTIPSIEELEHPKATEFACIQFTYDSKYLMAVSGEPDWYLYHFNWDKVKLESYTKAQNADGIGTVTIVECNPTDHTLIVLTGAYTFRIMNVLESAWRQWGWNKTENMIITACVWLNSDRIFIGTSKGEIMMIENGDLRLNCIFKASEVTEMSLKKIDVDLQEAAGVMAAQEDSAETAVEEEDSTVYPVKFLTNFQKGFAYACGEGFVYLFERESLQYYKRRSVFRICKKSYKSTREYPMWSKLDEILHMTVTPNEDYLLITTHRKQPFTVRIFKPITEQSLLVQEEYTPFTELGPSMHYGSINSLSMCAWKPIFMTSGEFDKSIRIWNYETENIEMVKIYQEEIFCVSLHPTGLFAIVGFSDKLRFMVVLIDDFEVMREFPVRNCKQAKFSTNGHLFAAVNSQVIQVYSSVSFQNIYNLKGHNGRITCLSWSANDLILVSCGAEGAVYEWSMSTGQRVGEIILKTNQFNTCAVNSVGKITYAAGSDGEIKQIGSSAINMKLDIKGIPLNTMALSRSNMMLFTSAGDGSIITISLPILEQNNAISEFNLHSTQVKALCLSYNDQILVSVSEDASIAIWRLLNPDGRAIALDIEFAHAKEILISRKDLQEKINSIQLLSTRMSELETEHTYQLRQSEATHAEKLKEIHDEYCATIEELKEKNENMENEHTHEIGSIQQDIAKLRASHEKTLQELEAEFNIRLISEYDRYESLENKSSRMRSEYEARLAELQDTKRQAMRALNMKFEAELEEKDLLLQEIQEQAELEKREHVTITDAIEEDADREILDLKNAFNAQLKEEKDANVRLKGEIGLMKKKLITARKEIDEHKHTIMQLKAEHKQFLKVISTLEKEITDIKKDIAERDSTIQDKEKRIFELKKKKSELEKYKFVLNYRIMELKNQIEPLERAIKASKVRTLELEESLEGLLKTRAFRELKIENIKEKLAEAKKQFSREVDKTLYLKSMLKQIKIDLHDMTGDFQDPVKLRHSVKGLFKKYTEDIDFLRNRAAEEEAVLEFYRQRDYLEKQVELCKHQLQKAYTVSKNDINKILDENCQLLSEINTLRTELKATRARCFAMESILGLSARYVPPATARERLRYVTEDREKLFETYHQKFAEKHGLITSLKEENERLLGKLNVVEKEERMAHGAGADGDVYRPQPGPSHHE